MSQYNGEPPLGVMPLWMWRENRAREILNALARYVEAGALSPSSDGRMRADMRSWTAELLIDLLKED